MKEIFNGMSFRPSIVFEAPKETGSGSGNSKQSEQPKKEIIRKPTKQVAEESLKHLEPRGSFGSTVAGHYS